MRFDLWELIGLLGEGLFFARLIVQWAASEKARKNVIPAPYWYMSLAGACILVAYALHIGSLVVLLPQIAGVALYSRGLAIERAYRRRMARRAALGLENTPHAWPTVSVIIPVHNEEKTLDATLRSVCAHTWPGAQPPQIIAALNGCTDGSAAVARRWPVTVVESAQSGMSFGKNLGARAATGSMLVFVDADTQLPPDALELLAEAAAGHSRYIGTVGGRPDRGGGVVRVCFWLANRYARKRRAHAPGGVMLMDAATWRDAGGFDESLPQGTSTDLIWRACAHGADYVYVSTFRAVTSIRRFEKTGIIRQMLGWRRNHDKFSGGAADSVRASTYEAVR